MTEPSKVDAAELGVRTVEYVNQAYVQGEEVELSQPPASGTRVTVVITPEEKSRIIRNVVTLSIAFMLTFMTKYGISNLQSSINAAQGLGTFSLTATYCGLVISNTILPLFLLRWLGSKWTVVLCFTLMVPYICLQYLPTFYSLIPASFLAGVVGAPMGVAANKYLAVTAEVYSDVTGTTMDVVIPRFFGTFLVFCQMAQVWGNLIPSVVLLMKEKSVNTSEKFILENCGVNFCQKIAGIDPNFSHPSEESLLLIVYLFMGILAVAIILVSSGIDSLTRYCEEKKEAKSIAVSGYEILGAMFKQLYLNRKLQLLVPLTFWLGLQQAFMNADYTASYISCAWGLKDVGYVMATYGLTNALFSLGIRCLVRLTGRVPAIIVAFFLHLGIFATLILWHPSSYTRIIFFVLTVVWGIADAIWIVQIISLYSIVSPGKEDAAFCNYDLWLSLGFISGFSMSSMLCTGLKVYIMLGLLLAGMTFYMLLEWLRYRQKQLQTSNQSHTETTKQPLPDLTRRSSEHQVRSLTKT